MSSLNVAAIATIIVVIYLLSSIKILREYERAVIFRLGRVLPQPKGPGIALVFAPIDRMVRISLRVETLEVGDDLLRISQIPVEEKYLPRLFERFYRIDKARSRKLGGTGLGLAIVKHITNLHGGSVSVESVPGKGSIFTIHLPTK